MIYGGASVTRVNKQDQKRLSNLFTSGVANAAVQLGATIVDGGTDASVMQLIGKGIAQSEHRSVLIGVVPASKVTYPVEDAVPLEPNHSHFVLVPGEEWRCETAIMYNLVKELAGDVPVMTIIAGGGSCCKREVLQTVRNDWLIFVIEGSGKVAD